MGGRSLNSVVIIPSRSNKGTKIRQHLEELKGNAIKFAGRPWPVWLLAGHHPVHQKVAGLIPGQDICSGCRLHPRWGVQEAADQCSAVTSHIDMYISLSPLPSPSS